MNVIGIRRNAAGSAGDPYATVTGPDGVDDLLRRSDYLAVTVVLAGDTRRMIGERELALMKPTARLINVARGDVVDPAALYRALVEKRIGGAALDVWYRYPTDAKPTFPAEQPFQDLPNVLMTPHVSGWTQGMLDERSKVIAANIARLESGKPLLNLIP
jgi:phosphoglycerate dehydrogenase-like enzyme